MTNSKTSSVVPLIITILLVVIAAAVAYVAYAVFTSISETTNQKMQKHNISMSRDGMKVGVKEINTEKYADKQQGVLVKVWNNASWPNYKSRLGWGQANKDLQKTGGAAGGSSTQASPAGAGSEHRTPFSRHTSNTQRGAKA